MPHWSMCLMQDSVTGVVRILDFGSAVLHGRVVGEEGLRGAHVPLGCTPGFRSPESLAAGYRPSFEVGGRRNRRYASCRMSAHCYTHCIIPLRTSRHSDGGSKAG